MRLRRCLSRVRHRRHRDHHSAVRRPRQRAGHRQRPLRHPLAGELPAKTIIRCKGMAAAIGHRPRVAHGLARRHRHRDHAAGAAQGLRVRHLPDGGERRRPGALLDRAAAARHPAARPGARAAPACAHRPPGRVRDPDRHRLRGRDLGLRRLAARPAHDLDQPQDPRALSRPVRRRATATRSRHGRTASWSAACTAWRSTARSSARACSRSRATPARWRSSICARA